MRALRAAAAALALAAALAGCGGARPTGSDQPWRLCGGGKGNKCIKTDDWCARARHKDDRWCRTHTPAECAFQWCKGHPVWCGKHPDARRCDGIPFSTKDGHG